MAEEYRSKPVVTPIPPATPAAGSARVTPVEPVPPPLGGEDWTLEHATVKWRAIFAGLFVALLIYIALVAMGVAIGSSTLRGAIQGEGAQGLGLGAAVWLAFSTLISLYSGAYAASRLSGPIPTRVGRLQGLVVTSLFFLVLLTQVGGMVGSLGRGMGSVVGGFGGAIGDAASSPAVQELVNEALRGLELRSDPNTIAQGVARRLVSGDRDGAARYFSQQTGITEAEARQRLDQLGDRFTTAVRDVGQTATRALTAAGWTLFGAMLFGSIIAMLGGGLGVQANLRLPVSRVDRRAIAGRRAA